MRNSNNTRSRRLAGLLSCLVALTLGISGSALAHKGKDGRAGDKDKKEKISKQINRPKNDFNIMMNYELGMHCTGFEFSYCCVLPVYNSILAQVVQTGDGKSPPELLEGDPNVGLDALGRPTVLRSRELDANGNFRKYVLRYWHEAQPRNDGRGAPQGDPNISLVEGNSLMAWNTVVDSAAVDANGALVTGTYNGASGVVLGNGDLSEPTDNYQNSWMNHLYIYQDLEGTIPTDANGQPISTESSKIRLGVNGHIVYPDNVGAALQPIGPIDRNDNSKGSPGPFDNVLTYSGEKGTVVYTQMKVLENLPVMLTSPRIWEALGLPLSPFEDSIDFFADPGAVDEDSVRPYVLMKAQLHNYDPTQVGGVGSAVLNHDGNPVIGFGTAPIDNPNCERCHSLGVGESVNSANNDFPGVAAMVQDEIDFWKGYYGIGAADSDWYPRVKAAAISILAIHDAEHGTSFTANYPGNGAGVPQNTRLGHEAVLCQKCHADNVIAVVKSAYSGNGDLIPPLTEAIHRNHQDNPFSDSLGRNGGCQGCHPAHRSDGDMAGYPITELGLNAYAAGDNRDAAGGCYVGRDVHSNRNRNNDGCETPSYLNAIGQWLVDNVVNDTGTDKGIWCTNCHTQLSQELWKAENVEDLIHAKPGDPGHVREPFVGATLADVVAGLPGSDGSPLSLAQAVAWLDPKTNADTAAIWKADPGLCDHVSGLFGGPSSRYQDGNVATIEVNLQADPIVPTDCSTGVGLPGPDCDGNGAPDFSICGTLDPDGDVSVNILDFCTTPDCVANAQASLSGPGQAAVPVPMSAATDGRDHWLSPGEPHCADCHAAPYVENTGSNNPYPPFNYPRKAALFRYSRGHRDITCQGCHESIHGLYPVTPDIDTTSYAQAASMNSDGSHGPLKCNACHAVNDKGVPTVAKDLEYNGVKIRDNYDAAVSWAHTFTDEHDPTQDLCTNCHKDKSSKVAVDEGDWLEHAAKGRVSRRIMDQVETRLLGAVAGSTDPLDTVCQGCHSDRRSKVACNEIEWKEHLPTGRVSPSVWEDVSMQLTGSTCGY